MEIQGDVFSDEDFRAVYSSLQAGGDPAVLQFDVELNSPGFLCVSFVFASDEFPFFIQQQFNDTFAILVKGPCAGGKPWRKPGDVCP